MPNDRRVLPRAAVSWRGQVRRYSGAYRTADIVDASLDGVSLISDRSLDVGESVELALMVCQPGLSSHIRLRGRVCYSRCLGANAGCNLGIELDNPPSIYRRRVEALNSAYVAIPLQA